MLASMNQIPPELKCIEDQKYHEQKAHDTLQCNPAPMWFQPVERASENGPQEESNKPNTLEVLRK